LLLGWAAGIGAGTAMAVAMNFMPTYSLTLGGFAFPSYTALYAVILNLAVATALTPVVNAMGGRRTPIGEPTAADSRA